MTELTQLKPSKTTLISVVINCYNGEKFLREALDSVYAQTYQNWEIVFWDNASTDNTKSIACSYQEKLKYFKAPELTNLHEARNLALDKCRGAAVAFLDADDVWLPNKLEKQIELFSEDNKIIYGGYAHIDQAGRRTGFTQTNSPSGSLTSKLISRNTISIGGVLIDTKLLKAFRFDETYEIMGDFDLWIRLSPNHLIQSVNEIVELSRQHSGNISSTHKAKWLAERRHFYKKFLRSHGIFKYPIIIWYVIKTELKGFL
jgi:glycosyltransferase involved in cell wall biosynthesis